MSRLSDKEFSNFITLMCKADDKQLEYVKTFAEVPSKARSLMADVIKKQVELAMQGVMKVVEKKKTVETSNGVEKKVEYVERTASGRAKVIKNPRKFEIKVIHGMSYVDPIPFSYERFLKFLQKQNLKAANNYVRGIERLFNETNVKVFTTTGGLSKMSLSDLEPARVSIAKNHTLYASTKRGWFKKFNDYLIHEYTLNKK